MKIGLLIYGSLETLSGGYLYDRQMVKHLRAHGHTVRVVSLPWRNYPRHLLDNLSPAAAHHLTAADRDVDLWVIDELCHPSLTHLAGRLRHPRVVLVHHLRVSEAHPPIWMPAYRTIERTFLRQADAFIFNSHSTARSVEALLGQHLNHPAVVAPPAADRFKDLPDLSYIQKRAQAPGPLRVIFIGNLIARKCVETLLQALRQLPPEAAELDVVGDPRIEPAYVRRLQALSRQPELRGRVRFHGRLDAAPLSELLRRAQVLAVPSQYEGFGIVYLEGMAFGLPALGSAHGGAAEIITPGQDGWLLEPGDAKTLADHLRRLHADRALLARMGQSARARFDRHPTWQESMARIRNFLENLA